MNVPPAWKRLLVPIWNRGHQLGWTAGEYAGAIGHGRLQRCTCCGHLALMRFRPRAIPPRLVELWGLSPRVARALARKETLLCSRCGAKLRARRMASVIIEQFPATGEPARSLRDWAFRPEFQSLSIAEINRIDGLHEAISPLPGLLYSEFFENRPIGTSHDGVRCETLSGLSYDANAFDLVLTSETLEHVPDLNRALAEIRRVLRPGGLHIFTVPVMPGVAKTYPRRLIDTNGEVHDLATPIHHPGGDVGYPVFTEFGADLVDLIDREGFATEVRFGPLTEDDLAQVFVSRKV